MTTDQVTGTVGVGFLLLAYFLNIFSILPKRSRMFFILNIMGAGLACYASYLIHYWPFIILEGIWTVVSLVGFLRA